MTDSDRWDTVSSLRSDDDGLWFDDEAGPLIRVFAVTGGRTRPNYPLDMVTLVMATTRLVDLPPTPEHAAIARLCPAPRSVAEVAATLELPLVSTKVLISDLIDVGAMTYLTPRRSGQADDPDLIRTVIDAIRQL